MFKVFVQIFFQKMSVASFSHKFTSIIMVGVLFWNIAGWLGFGLIMNHMNKHGHGTHCEIALCSCKVEKEGDICTCHHKDYWNSGEHEDETHENFCYYTNPHSNGTSTSQTLIPISQINAVDFSEMVKWSSPRFEEYRITYSFNLPSETLSDLLRPPQM